MNQLPLNKNELPLIREMLTKYKQGYISGLIPGSNITFSPSGCRNKIVSSTGGGGGGAETDPTVPAYAKTLTSFSAIKANTDALYEPLFSKNTAFNKNFGTTSGTVVEGNDSRVLNGQTAFGWGNHALAGYQSLLVSGTNIKTINGNSVLGSGDLVIGGGSSFETKTKAEIDTLIAGNDLVAGALYEITGVHPTLYDDGTTSGTTVYLRAISGSELEVQGMGKFYNPKYNQSVDGFGIWYILGCF